MGKAAAVENSSNLYGLISNISPRKLNVSKVIDKSVVLLIHLHERRGT